MVRVCRREVCCCTRQDYKTETEAALPALTDRATLTLTMEADGADFTLDTGLKIGPDVFGLAERAFAFSPT